MTLIFFILFFVIQFSQAQYKFTPVKEIEHTSIKNQCNTGTCWSFSTLSFLESEALRINKKTVDLSEMYIVHSIYQHKAQNYVLRQGEATFSDGSLSHDVMYVLKNKGLIPEDITSIKDPDYHDHTELLSLLKGMLKQIIKDKAIGDLWQNAYRKVLDLYLGEQPESFEFENKKYTPKSFAASLGLDESNYVNLTSFTHHPFLSEFILEIPDNYSNGSYLNIPIDDLVRITDEALDNGYTIAWDGDVSEKYFSSQQGVAIIPEKGKDVALKSPQKEKKITQEIRQKAFENYKTTDDHLMHIVGTAKDQKGNMYYKVKNSWGEKGKEKGYIYMSKTYFKYKTISILLHKEAVEIKGYDLK